MRTGAGCSAGSRNGDFFGDGAGEGIAGWHVTELVKKLWGAACHASHGEKAKSAPTYPAMSGEWITPGAASPDAEPHPPLRERLSANRSITVMPVACRVKRGAAKASRGRGVALPCGLREVPARVDEAPAGFRLDGFPQALETNALPLGRSLVHPGVSAQRHSGPTTAGMAVRESFTHQYPRGCAR